MKRASNGGGSLAASRDGARLRVAAARPGANLNALLDEHARDPLSGNAVLSGVAIALAPLP